MSLKTFFLFIFPWLFLLQSVRMEMYNCWNKIFLSNSNDQLSQNQEKFDHIGVKIRYFKVKMRPKR